MPPKPPSAQTNPLSAKNKRDSENSEETVESPKMAPQQKSTLNSSVNSGFYSTGQLAHLQSMFLQTQQTQSSGDGSSSSRAH